MRFKRFLAIILLLILPLQSTLAAIDSCCNGAVTGQALESQIVTTPPDTAGDGVQAADEADCCSLCDFCNHASGTFLTGPSNLHGQKITDAPVPSPELPIDSFIPDVPSRPDRA